MTKLERDKLRTAVADYMRSEGCSCCSDQENHTRALFRLGHLLSVRKYKDGSGYDFSRYESEKPARVK